MRLASLPGSILIEVEDDGPGIAVEQREEVFAPFRRLDPARSHTIPGAGLGLTIARDVVQSHGGTITQGTTAQRGLLVRIALPVAAAIRDAT